MGQNSNGSRLSQPQSASDKLVTTLVVNTPPTPGNTDSIIKSPVFASSRDVKQAQGIPPASHAPSKEQTSSTNGAKGQSGQVGKTTTEGIAPAPRPLSPTGVMTSAIVGEAPLTLSTTKEVPSSCKTVVAPRSNIQTQQHDPSPASRGQERIDESASQGPQAVSTDISGGTTPPVVKESDLASPQGAETQRLPSLDIDGYVQKREAGGNSRLSEGKIEHPATRGKLESLSTRAATSTVSPRSPTPITARTAQSNKSTTTTLPVQVVPGSMKSAQSAQPAQSELAGPVPTAKTTEMLPSTQTYQPIQNPKASRSGQSTHLSQQAQAKTQENRPTQPTQTAQPIQTGPSANTARSQESTRPVTPSLSLTFSSSLSSSLSAAPSSSISDMFQNDDGSSNASVSMSTGLSGPDVDPAEFQSQLKTLQTDMDCVKVKGDETEQRINSLEREIRGRLEKLEEAVVKVERLEATLERVDRLHSHFNLIQDLEGKLAMRVEVLEEGFKKMYDAVFPTSLGQSLDPGASGKTDTLGSTNNIPRLAANDPALVDDLTNNSPSDSGLEHHNSGDDPKPTEDSEPKHQPPTINGPATPLWLGGGEPDIPDGEIEGLFMSLESKIQALVQRHFEFNVDKTSAASIAKSHWSSGFPSDDWENSESSPKLAWFRSLVANLIHAELFAKPFFGCSDEAIEGGLAGFERLMAGDGQSTSKHHLRLATSRAPLIECA